jgi:hypothetical protein
MIAGVARVPAAGADGVGLLGCSSLPPGELATSLHWLGLPHGADMFTVNKTSDTTVVNCLVVKLTNPRPGPLSFGIRRHRALS